MSGYNWIAGMSNNAVDAYYNGEKPLSKWKKAEILAALNVKETLKAEIQKLSLKDLKKVCLYESSWHHTSKFFNKTYFYAVEEDEETIVDNFQYLKKQKIIEKIKEKMTSLVKMQPLKWNYFVFKNSIQKVFKISMFKGVDGNFSLHFEDESGKELFYNKDFNLFEFYEEFKKHIESGEKNEK